MDNLYFWLGTGFGVGSLPFAPGTLGALLGLPLAWCLARWSLKVQLPVMLGLLGVAVWVCGQLALMQGEHDPGNIVLDEIVAFPWTMVGLGVAHRIRWLLLAFVIFRAFDILKPWPVNSAEQWAGGWGIVADDVVAALCTWLIILVILFFMNNKLPFHGK